MIAAANALVFFYLLFSRTFAYAGIAPFYPAETFLLGSIACRANRLIVLFAKCIRSGDVIFYLVLLFLILGMVQAGRGIVTDGTITASFKGFAAHFYPLFFYLGIVCAQGDTAERFAERYWWMATLGGAYGLLWTLFLSNADIAAPWAPGVKLFSDASGILFLTVGAIALAPGTRRNLLLPLVALFSLLLGPVERASVLGALAGLAIVVQQQRSKRLLLNLTMVAIGVIILSTVVGSLITIGGGIRSGSMTLSWTLARLLSLVAPDQAYSMLVKMGSYQEAYQIYALNSDVGWRWRFWDDVIRSLDSQWLWFIGHGYGVALGAFAGHGEGLRTPHNFFIYFLGYTGGFGVLVFIMLLSALLYRILRLPKSPLRTFMLATLAGFIVRALASNSFETPYSAVPFYLMLGMAYGLATQATEDQHCRTPRLESWIRLQRASPYRTYQYRNSLRSKRG